MGAEQSGVSGVPGQKGSDGGLLDGGLPFCCGNSSSMSNCIRGGGQGNEILRAPPMSYDQSGGGGSEVPTWQPPSTSGNAGGDGWQAHKPGGGGSNHYELGDGDTEETYDDGSTYTGQLVGSKRNGRGVWKSASEEYSGQWKDDQRDGQGRQTWHDGRIYEGQFKAGKFHGQGKMEWHMPNGLMVYEGQYVDDLKDGHGRYIWPDNRVYDGEWNKGMREGRATFTNAAGRSRKSIWKQNKVERYLEDEPRP